MGTQQRISVKEAAKRYGMSVKWFYVRALRGDIPSYKVGNRRLFRVDEIEDWFEKRRHAR